MSDNKTGYAQGVSIVSAYKATSSTKLTSLTWLPARSSRTGIRSRSSLSCASENQLLIGTACCGWKMYDVGELSIMIVSFKSRPICERSCIQLSVRTVLTSPVTTTYLHVVALVVITTFSEKPVSNDLMDIQFVQHRIGILYIDQTRRNQLYQCMLTLLRLAVKTTIS